MRTTSHFQNACGPTPEHQWTACGSELKPHAVQNSNRMRFRTQTACVLKLRLFPPPSRGQGLRFLFLFLIEKGKKKIRQRDQSRRAHDLSFSERMRSVGQIRPHKTDRLQEERSPSERQCTRPMVSRSRAARSAADSLLKTSRRSRRTATATTRPSSAKLEVAPGASLALADAVKVPRRTRA